MKRVCLVMSLLLMVLTLGCGGSAEESQLNDLRAQAAAKEAEARSLVVDSPCSEDNQCGALVFGATTHMCGPTPPVAYLLAARTSAQAVTAAEQQRALALQVQLLLPSDGIACPFVTPVLPKVSCSAARCISGA